MQRKILKSYLIASLPKIKKLDKQCSVHIYKFSYICADHYSRTSRSAIRKKVLKGRKIWKDSRYGSLILYNFGHTSKSERTLGLNLGKIYTVSQSKFKRKV
jgi:hypothetical protein